MVYPGGLDFAYHSLLASVGLAFASRHAYNPPPKTQIFDQAFYLPVPTDAAEQPPQASSSSSSAPAAADNDNYDNSNVPSAASVLEARRRHAAAFNAAWYVWRMDGWMHGLTTLGKLICRPNQPFTLPTPQYTHRSRARPGVEQLLEWPHKLGRPLRWFATLGYRVAAYLDEERCPVPTLVGGSGMWMDGWMDVPLWYRETIPPTLHNHPFSRLGIRISTHQPTHFALFHFLLYT